MRYCIYITEIEGVEMKTNNYRSDNARRAGRYAAQDKARRASAKAIEDAEDVVTAARSAFYESLSDEDQAAMKTAEDALYQLDPTSYLFS